MQLVFILQGEKFVPCLDVERNAIERVIDCMIIVADPIVRVMCCNYKTAMETL